MPIRSGGSAGAILSQAKDVSARLEVGFSPSIMVPSSSAPLAITIDPNWLSKHPDTWKPEKSKRRFQFVDLEGGLQETAAVNYADTEVIGRVEGYKTYTGNSNREVTFTVQLRVQGVAEHDLWVAIAQEVVLPAQWLEGLKYSMVGPGGLVYSPPPCILQIGALLKGRVLATAIDVTWQPPFTQNMLPHGADVACTFTFVRKSPEAFSFGSGR